MSVEEARLDIENEKLKQGRKMLAVRTWGIGVAAVVALLCAIINNIRIGSRSADHEVPVACPCVFKAVNVKCNTKITYCPHNKPGESHNSGNSVANGQGCKKDEREAVKWFRKAEEGDAWAQYNLGLSLFNGEGCEKDEAEAVKWYRKAAGNGNACAKNELGLSLFDGLGCEKDEREAVRLWREAVEEGNVCAQFNLGLALMNGHGCEKDEREAVRLWREAAEEGDARAQCNLGVSLLNGQGCEKDEAEAVKWFRKAAEQGDAIAQLNVAMSCEEGFGGVQMDLTQAEGWYLKALNYPNADKIVCEVGGERNFLSNVAKAALERVWKKMRNKDRPQWLSFFLCD